MTDEEKQEEHQPLHILQVELALTYQDGRKEGSTSPILFGIVQDAPSSMALPDGSQMIPYVFRVKREVVEEWQGRLREVMGLLELLKHSDGKPVPGLKVAAVPMGPMGPMVGGPGGSRRSPGRSR